MEAFFERASLHRFALVFEPVRDPAVGEALWNLLPENCLPGTIARFLETGAGQQIERDRLLSVPVGRDLQHRRTADSAMRDLQALIERLFAETRADIYGDTCKVAPSAAILVAEH